MRWHLSKVGIRSLDTGKGLVAVVKFRGMIGFVAASAMLFSSTGAIAAAAPAPSSQPSPWAVLTVMSNAAAAANVCGVAAAAAAAGVQPTGGCVLPQVDAPVAAPVTTEVPPAPLVATPVAGLGVSPLLLGLAALAAGIGLYFAVRNNNGNNSNSPA